MSEPVDTSITPAAGDTAAPTAPSTSGAPVAQPTTQAVSQPPATGGVPDGYVPSYRIREAREAAVRQAQNEWGQKEAGYKAQLEQYQKNLQALTGVQPQHADPVREVRDQFGRVYPNLAKLEDQYDKVEQLLNRFPDLEAQTEHYWTAHATQTLDKLYSLATTDLGGSLSDSGRDNLRANFVGWLQSNPEAAQRYAYDPPVVNEFWKAFTSHFIEPIRRTQASQTVARVPNGLPQDAPSGNSITGGAVKPKNLDERGDAAWATFKSLRKSKTPVE